MWVPETRSAVPKSLVSRRNRSFGTPHGQVETLRLKDGVIDEPFTGTNYCNAAAGASGVAAPKPHC